ncbi:HsdR family type I site-specific deoxyribonuclease [Candidatus Peregrinibacteria bacterium]|nr:HsdR family type I site-specific deoxyribonuclease [Candidatus Peregrinibacteria bacterium]
MRFNEQYTVENYIISFFEHDLGYEYIKPEDFKKLREFDTEYLIHPLLRAAIKRINHLEDDTEVENVVREIKKIETNEGFLEVMRNGVNLKDPQTHKMRDYLVVDFENPENNDFVITNQFVFEGNEENIRPDMIVILNGLPIADIEAKSPTASAMVNYEKAIDQIKRYEKNARNLFLPNCFNLATDGMKTVYGATSSPKQYFFQWRDETLEEVAGGNLEMTLISLFQQNNLLDIIQNFIVFEKEKGRTIKKICRYQQFRAANLIVDRTVEGKKKKGLVWHTQGSGKSITMFFAAWKLRFEPHLKNPKVFVLVDRIDLDDQIFETFINCGGKNVIRATSRRDLEQKIKSPERGIFISTIQKFNELSKDTVNIDDNVIVLSDEAHRDNEGIAAIKLRSSMKNAFFFGFTGTPIDKKTLNTHRNFGEEGERYLDYYSIQQAIDDGATLPVTYEARLSKFAIDEEKVDEQFEEFTGDLSDEEKQELIKKYGKKSALVKLEKRMRAVALDIVEHFKLYIEPNGFKAQIVCYDREASAMYKKLLDELIPKEWSKVVYSPGDPNSDDEQLKKYNTNKRDRERIIDAFKRKEDPLRFLIVCDMLLTGFDAPIEQVMYLDKPLRDHNLLQAIARTNRVYNKEKGCGKIIDYYGITRNLHEALDFDESVVDSAMIDIDEYKKRFEALFKEVMELFSGVNTEDPSMENLRKCLKIFFEDENKQQFFYDNYNNLKILFEILSPDPFLVDYLRKFEWLASFYIAFIREYRNEEASHGLSEYGGKMQVLIQSSVDYEGITKNFRELKINDIYTLERLEKMEDEEKAVNLEKMLKREISINIETNPVFKKFSERLKAIRTDFEQNQIDLAQRIKAYYELMEDIKQVGEKAEDMGLDLKEYAIFTITQGFAQNATEEDLIEFSKTLTDRLDKILDSGWQESSKRETFLKDIKREVQILILKEFKERIDIEDFQKYLNELTELIVKKF